MEAPPAWHPTCLAARPMLGTPPDVGIGSGHKSPNRRKRMDNDDRQVGRVLSRREALKLMAAASAAMLAACGPAETATVRGTARQRGRWHSPEPVMVSSGQASRLNVRRDPSLRLSVTYSGEAAC